jgi:hypothetical protein
LPGSSKGNPNTISTEVSARLKKGIETHPLKAAVLPRSLFKVTKCLTQATGFTQAQMAESD